MSRRNNSFDMGDLNWTLESDARSNSSNGYKMPSAYRKNNTFKIDDMSLFFNNVDGFLSKRTKFLNSWIASAYDIKVPEKPIFIRNSSYYTAL